MHALHYAYACAYMQSPWSSSHAATAQAERAHISSHLQTHPSQGLAALLPPAARPPPLTSSPAKGTPPHG